MLNRVSSIIVYSAISLALTSSAFAQRGGAAEEPDYSSNKVKREWVVKDRAFELAKLDHAEEWTALPGGPNGTECEGLYRSLIKTNEKSVEMGQPSHADAAAGILEVASRSPEDLQEQKQNVLFILCFSQKYRPEEGTVALKGIYNKLLDLEFGAAEKQSAPAGDAQQEQLLAELAKFDNAGEHFEKPGPGGTEWDPQYRSLIKSNEKAVEMGQPSHQDAVDAIMADAALSVENAKMHKNYVLFIRHHSESYRPHDATVALRTLYRYLTYLSLGIEPDWSYEPREEPANRPYEGDTKLTIHRDVVYGTIDPQAQDMDVYLVPSDKPTPVLIEIHGGGWRRGQKNMFDTYPGDLIQKTLDAGISIITINYRLTDKYPMPAQMEDATRAVQFIRSKAEEWNIDPNRIAAMGGSAGAHLSAWIALNDDQANPSSADPVERFSSRISCFIDNGGPIDLTRIDPVAMSRQGSRGVDMSEVFPMAFGGSIQDYGTPEIQAKAKAASPYFKVTPDDPPAFICHQGPAGFDTKDHPPIPKYINDPHSHYFGALLGDAMEEAGIEVVRDIGPNVGKDREKDANAKVAFLKKHLTVE